MDHSRHDPRRARAVRPTSVRSAALAALLLLAAGPLPAPPITRVPTPVQPMSDQTRNAPGRKVLREGDLPKSQFRFRLNALTNEQLVDWKGQRMSKLAFLAAAGRRIRAVHLQVNQQAAPHGQAELVAARSRFTAEEAARLAARNDLARAAAQQRIAELLATAPAPAAASAGPAPTARPADPPSDRPSDRPSDQKRGAAAGGALVVHNLAAGRGVAAAPPSAGAGGGASAVAGAADLPACPGPRITYAPPFALSPGSYVAVVGCGFGAGAGDPAETGKAGDAGVTGGAGGAGGRQLTLKLQTDQADVPLVVKEWHDSWITASVPAGLAGLVDQGALLVVRAPAAPAAPADDSAGWLIPFRAARELRALRPSEVPVERCGATADANYCNHEAHLEPGYWGLLDKSGLGNPAEPYTSAAGYHADDASPEGDRGLDVYHLRLGHGWSLAGFAFHFDAAPGAGTAAPPQDFEPGYAEQVLMVPWAISGEGSVVYYLDLFATGPRGTAP
jgi:hypothetical protein